MKVLPRHQFQALAKRQNIPTEAQFEVTSQCHLHCVMCIRTVLEKTGELSTEEVKDALRQCRDLGVLRIGYTGGEIFLRPDLMEIFDTTEELGFKFGFITTGTRITPAQYRRLAEYQNLDRVGISIYSLRPRVQAAVTQHNTLRQSLKALFTFQKLGIPVRVNAPIMSLNHADVVTLKTFLNERGLAYVGDMSLAPTDAGDQTPLQYMVNPGHYPRLGPILKKMEKGPTACSAGAESLSDPHPFCGVGRNTLAINAHGDFFPCSILRVKFGNLRETPLKTAWASSPALQQVRDHRTTEVLNCKQCDYLTSCQMCLGLTQRYKGDFTAPPGPGCVKIATPEENEIEAKVLPESAEKVTVR